AVFVFALVFFVIARGRDQCAAPAIDPSSVWSEARGGELVKADQAPGVEVIGADFAKWQQVRERACNGEPAARGPRLACLDGVLANLEVTARALGAVTSPH